jgi:hypothetical protein
LTFHSLPTPKSQFFKLSGMKPSYGAKASGLSYSGIGEIPVSNHTQSWN